MDELLKVVIDEARRLSLAGQDAGYEEYERLVEFRQTLTDELKEHTPLTDEQKKSIQELLKLDPIILAHMQRLKDEAQEGLSHLNTTKKQNAAYNHQGISDSIMFDRRK